MIVTKWVAPECSVARKKRGSNFEFAYSLGGKLTYNPSYYYWNKMKYRCNPDGAEQKKNPTYIGCTYQEDWGDFDGFMQWATQQKGFLSVDENQNVFQLDKDLLCPRNKVYGEETCLFLPKRLNGFLINRKPVNLPVGVSYHQHTGKYQAQVNLVGVGCGNKYLGVYTDPEAACDAYCDYKMQIAKQLALLWADHIDSRAFDALLRYNPREYVG